MESARKGPVGVAVGTTMLALGDSIAAGIGAPHVSLGCMWLVWERLRQQRPGIELANLARPGESSSSMLDPDGQLDRAAELIDEVTRRGGVVSPLLLSIGGNDAMEARAAGEEAAATRLRRNLETVLSRLDEELRRSGSTLAGSACLQTVYDPFRQGHGSLVADELAPRRAARGFHNREIRGAATRFGIDIADVAIAFSGRTDELTWVRSGDIHPTLAGHELIAQTYIEACGWDRAAASVRSDVSAG